MRRRRLEAIVSENWENRQPSEIPDGRDGTIDAVRTKLHHATLTLRHDRVIRTSDPRPIIIRILEGERGQETLVPWLAVFLSVRRRQAEGSDGALEPVRVDVPERLRREKVQVYR